MRTIELIFGLTLCALLIVLGASGLFGYLAGRIFSFVVTATSFGYLAYLFIRDYRQARRDRKMFNK